MNLKQLRQENGLSQVKASLEIGISFNTYIRWETGVVTPNEENKIKLDKFIERCKNGEFKKVNKNGRA